MEATDVYKSRFAPLDRHWYPLILVLGSAGDDYAQAVLTADFWSSTSAAQWWVSIFLEKDLTLFSELDLNNKESLSGGKELRNKELIVIYDEGQLN